MKDKDCRIALTGASGYVGGRLLPLLEGRGHRVRCLTRRPAQLAPPGGLHREYVRADALDQGSLEVALEGVSLAYYLIHSMGAGKDFEERDRQAAENFGRAAKRAGVDRMIYLGGLGNREHQLSRHLRSRQETGDILRSSGVQVIEFRASIVIGAGSLSFEIIRCLVDRLPVMICPRWVRVLAQPIFVGDLLEYLVAALDLPGQDDHIFEIGGPDRLSYEGIMREYARQRGLRRLMVNVPVLTPRLSGLWLGLVTPVYARVGRQMVESLRNPTIVSSNLAEKTFRVRPIGVSEAVARALANEEPGSTSQVS